MKIHLKYPFVVIASITTIIAGILHATTVAFEHAAIPPEFWFFIVLGVTQVVWGLNFFYHRTSNMYFVGSVLNLGSTFFWLAVRIFPAPFSDVPEEIRWIGIITALIQVIAFAASFWALYRFHRTTVLSIVSLLVLSSFLAGLGYVTAKSSEGMLLQIWPEINEAPHGHGDEAEDEHTEEEDSDPDHID
jgi:hypothetical protein